jgi:molybdopterin molybdotransferase
MPDPDPFPLAARSPAEAIQRFRGRVAAVGVERLPLSAASGRVLAEDVTLDRPSPALDVSAMDGWAFRAADRGRSPLPIAGESRAGAAPPACPPGQAVRIMTGAALPAGADCVLRREEGDDVGDAVAIHPSARIARGQHVRRAGENAAAGTIVASAGTILAAASCGACAAAGAATVAVRRRVRIAMAITGDEVLDVDAAPAPWQLRDSNGAALAAMLDSCRWVELVARERLRDDAEAMVAALDRLGGAADLVVITGGVSVGRHDHVAGAIATLVRRRGGATLVHRVDQRPGKPFLGAMIADVPVLGLPGNPVSAMVTCRRIGRAIAALRGGCTEPPPAALAVPEHVMPLALWWHRPVRIRAPGLGELSDGRGSGDLVAAGASDGFVEIPPLAEGAGPWPFYPWAW